jgi:hypothetical protein
MQSAKGRPFNKAGKTDEDAHKLATAKHDALHVIDASLRLLLLLLLLLLLRLGPCSAKSA